MTTRILLLTLILISFTISVYAQWGRSQTGVTISRGQIGHTVFHTGQSGRKDNGGRQEWSSFSYPMGRSPLVYSGGALRRGWNARSNSGGEGIWIMSKTGDKKHVSAAGNRIQTEDIVGIPGDPSQWPEAYVGATNHIAYALSNHRENGLPALWTRGTDLRAAKTNWWPSRKTIASPKLAPLRREAVSIWNFRYGRYNSGRSFDDQIATGDLESLNPPAWASGLSENDFPEQIVISRGKSTETGLQWTRKWFAWGHTDYDDFLIAETVVENTSSMAAEGVYIVLQNRFLSQAANDYRSSVYMKPSAWSSDDYARSTMAVDYLQGVSREGFLSGEGKPAGLPIGKELAEQGHAMLYAHDGESTHISKVHLDVGDPYRYQWAYDRFVREQTWIREGFLNHGQYFGVGVVDALPPFHTYGGVDPEIYISPRDNPETAHDESQKQPASIAIWRFINHNEFDHPSPLIDSPEHIYDTLSQAGFHNEPSAPFSYSHFMTFGPYDLQPGEKAKVVVAYVGGTGANAPKYSDYKRYAQPFTLSWLNLYDGPNLPDVSFLDRQPEVPEGEEALFRHFQRAIDAYNWGYDLPNEPPNVKLSFDFKLDGKTRLRWSSFGETSNDPDYEGTEAQDLRGYRLYRSTTLQEGPWELINEFSFQDAQSGLLPEFFEYHPNEVFHTTPLAGSQISFPLRENPYLSGHDLNAGDHVRGLYTFLDREVQPGFNAWYSLRYIDSGHDDWNGTGQTIDPLESAPGPAGSAVLSHFANNGNGIIPHIPGSAIYDRLEKQVRVVPNPWKANDDLHSYNRTEIMRFTNLPGRCQIDLYDTTGQKFWTFFNNDPLKAEVRWNHLTNGRPTQFGNAVYSGIYFWKVTSLMPESMGKVQKGTFVIIK